MIKSKTFKTISYLEGFSLLILLFIAMPIKYIYNIPLAVRIVGTVHGLLFILFLLYLINISIDQKWNLKSQTTKIFLASIIPFGFFYIDKKINDINLKYE